MKMYFVSREWSKLQNVIMQLPRVHPLWRQISNPTSARMKQQDNARTCTGESNTDFVY